MYKKKMLFIVFLFSVGSIYAQGLQKLNVIDDGGLGIVSFMLQNGQEHYYENVVPLFTFEADDVLFSSSDAKVFRTDSSTMLHFDNLIECEVVIDQEFSPGWKAHLWIRNLTDSSISVKNILPIGEDPQNTIIKATPPWTISSSKLFRPGYGDVGVVLPDNLWNMGYASRFTSTNDGLCGIARRTASNDSTSRRRFWTVLKQEGEAEYDIYIDAFNGSWQRGLQLMFQERFLYDLESFDYTLWEREDLKWIQNQYIAILMMAWDHLYYDRETAQYKYHEFLDYGKKIAGGFDIFGIWPTWPTLGLDQRNQWDLYEDLPGGLDKLNEFAQYSRENGTRFFIAYNPWDQSTRGEDHLSGMARLIKAIDADGVVLDTRGSSSDEIQKAADGVRDGVVMYSEGMAIVKDMPGILSGRVHNALVMPGPLNLNKFIKPDFAIFRVGDFRDGHLIRGINMSLFNGYGFEVNMFPAARPPWMEEEFLYMGRMGKTLRENTSAFNSYNFTPLIETTVDSIWVNKWELEEKTVYTIFSLIPEGYSENLFEVEPREGYHYVDIWHHEERQLDTVNNVVYLPCEVGSFDADSLGTRMESTVDVIAELPISMDVSFAYGDSLYVHPATGDSIVISAGNPSYTTASKTFDANNLSVSLYQLFPKYEGKVVVELFKQGELLDERIIEVPLGTPRLISTVQRTEPLDNAPDGMVEIPSGELTVSAVDRWSFIPYPELPPSETISIQKFYMDTYPVTNAQYKEFLEATGYAPEDTVNYLSHWNGNTFHDTLANHPVVYVSIEDAKAYAEWAGKRLPTEWEWQYAGQGSDTISYPWGSQLDSTKCNKSLGYTTPVDAFPDGESEFGVMDMVGNVWQLTNDRYDNSTYQFVEIRGGSYYEPTSSWWYVQGGAVPLNHRQMLILVSPGFERNATLGFRCVKDAK